MGNAGGWMAFVDGENLTIRAQEVLEAARLKLIEGTYFRRDSFIWAPSFSPKELITKTGILASPLLPQAPRFVRAYYYTSICGDDNAIEDVRNKLWGLEFNHHVFKKAKKELKAKGVDIALSKDMLSHAFLGNYDVAILLAGDGDYVPLIEEIKRLGKQVWVLFFKHSGLSEQLRLASDGFVDISELFVFHWSRFIQAQ